MHLWAAEDLTAIASVTQSDGATNLSSEWRVGWTFDVGASGISVTALRVFVRSTNTQRVRIHRVSDGVLMATADLTGVSGSWVEASITPVALAASTRYAITNRRVSSSAESHERDPSSITYASQITWKFAIAGATTDDMPTAGTSTRVYSNTDFRFTT